MIRTRRSRALLRNLALAASVPGVVAGAVNSVESRVDAVVVVLESLDDLAGGGLEAAVLRGTVLRDRCSGGADCGGGSHDDCFLVVGLSEV